MIRSTYRILALTLCALALFLAGCTQGPSVPTTSATAGVPKSPLEQYNQARHPVDRAENLILSYTVSESRTVGASILPRSVTGTASYSGVGKKDMIAVVEESLRYGSYTASYTEAYCDRLSYAVVNGSYFSSEMTPEVFIDRQVPAILITGELYGSVTREHAKDAIILTFTQPTRLESWVTTQKATLTAASGTATLDTAGNLLQTSYQAEYLLGNVRYKLEMSVRVTTPKSLDLSAKHPAHDQDCVPLGSLDPLKYLMQVVGDVYAAQQISCQSEEVIYSEAIPLTYTQTGFLTLSGFDNALAANSKYITNLSDYRGQVSEKTQEDLFADGVFTRSVNGSDPVVQDWVTARQMRQRLEDEILSGLIAVKYLGGATVTDSGKLIRLDFTGNDSFSADLMKTITDFLKVDLDEEAEEVRTQLASGYLLIRKDSGLPVEMGISLEKIHTINTVVYHLSHTLRQNLRFE